MTTEHFGVSWPNISCKLHGVDHLLWSSLHESAAAASKNGVTSENSSVDILCDLEACLVLSCVAQTLLLPFCRSNVKAGVPFGVARCVVASDP